MKATILAICLVFAFAIVPTSTFADHESSDCEITTSEPDVEAGGIAIFVDYIEPSGAYSVWIYQESNGIDGIQRADSVGEDELCGHGGDTIIF